MNRVIKVVIHGKRFSKILHPPVFENKCLNDWNHYKNKFFKANQFIQKNAVKIIRIFGCFNQNFVL